MNIRLKGTISDGDFNHENIDIEVTWEDYGLAPAPAKVEEVIEDLAAKLVRKMIAARVA